MKMAQRHYVDYSRFSNPDNNLFVLDPATKEIHVDPCVHVEMARLRSSSTSSCISNGHQRQYQIPDLIQIVIHNTRSLTAHIDDIRFDCSLLAGRHSGLHGSASEAVVVAGIFANSRVSETISRTAFRMYNHPTCLSISSPMLDPCLKHLFGV
jgi:hypothetical protein